MARPAAPRSLYRVALALLPLALLACGDKSGKLTPDDPGGGTTTVIKPATPALEELVGQRIARIDITGISELRRDHVRGAIYTRAGDLVDLDKISADVRALWKLGGMKDVRAEAAVTSDGGTIIRFIVVEQPILHAIDFTGNDAFSRTVLDALLRVETGKPVNMVVVRDGRTALRQYYMEHGYLKVAIAWRVEDTDAGTELVYDIHEGEAVTISKIDFEGNTAATDAELAALIVGPNGMNAVGGAYVAELMYDALGFVSNWYYDRGYITLSTSAPSAAMSDDATTVEVSINIVEGDQYRIGKVTMSGDVAADDKKYLAAVSFKKGQIFNRSKVVNTVTLLTDLHKKAGFPNAIVTPLTNIDGEKHTVDLEFQVVGGNR
jgi:outer membrane protein insertion porin family